MTAAAAPAPAQPIPGSMVGYPGSQRMDEPDVIEDVITTMSPSQQVPVSVTSFEDTNVVFWWRLYFNWVNTPTAGTGQTLTLSPYAPYNLIQNLQLRLQGKENSINLQSGIDAAIFELIRPTHRASRRNNLLINPATLSANSGLFSPNLQGASNLAAASSPVTFALDLPASVYLDSYFDLDITGNITGVHQGQYVSPQYMGGTTRKVRPKFSLAPGFAANTDLGPLVTTSNTASGDTASTYAGNVTLNSRRVGLYSTMDPARLPLEWNWQYTRSSQQELVGAATKWNTQLSGNTYGQIMSLFVRFYDPLANGGLGAPVPMSNIATCRVTQGSSTPRFDDTPQSMQERLIQQHGILNPAGCLMWDFTESVGGKVTNAGALNTYNTGNIGVQVTFNTAPSAETYAVIGTEMLQFVAAG